MGGVEAPLMDMMYHDASTHLISSGETILYLTDKSHIGGVDCHQNNEHAGEDNGTQKIHALSGHPRDRRCSNSTGEPG